MSGISPAIRVKFIQAAKEGNLEALKQFVQNDKIPIDTTDSEGFTALHWASACGQPDVINFLIFNHATINIQSRDGNTPLHLAAKYHKLNSVHFLLEAGADPSKLNEARETPLQLCGEDPPMKAILSGAKPASDKNQVLTAAKDLLNSTLTPVIAFEETIALACQKATDDASAIKTADSSDFSICQSFLTEYKKSLDEFKSSVAQIGQYKSQIEVNTKNIATMEETLDEMHKEVMEQLQRSRTANAATKEKQQGLGQRKESLTAEMKVVSDQITDLETKLNALKSRRAELQKQLEEVAENSEKTVQNDTSEVTNETTFAEQLELIHATRESISKGMEMLTSLDSRTSQRHLETGLKYGEFLRNYMNYIKKLVTNLEENKGVMEERINIQGKNKEEAQNLHLKLDPSRINELITEYQQNKERFERHKQKVMGHVGMVQSEYEDVKRIVGKFGRELEPLAKVE